ncbi:MAG: zinc ABC transporter substrate-binding protein [Erysipelotrichaceae bacterium]|nr:zinc ABC transporter substrate-binding protein [Erysipelotrichaceae bacterium]
MLKKMLVMILSAVMSLCLLSGCSLTTKKIVYTVYPVGYLLHQLAGDTITVQSIQTDAIVQRANIADDYQMILEDASLFLHIGALEPYISLYSNEIRSYDIETIDLSLKNSIYDFKRYTRAIVDGEVVYTISDYYKGDVFKTIDVNEKDLYLWTDPISMVSMAREIKNWLQNMYPEDAAFYEENFESLESSLILLDAQYTALSTKLKEENKSVKFVSMTASFGNWQRTYGIQVYPVILSKYGVLPNDQQLEEIKQRIKEDGVRYIANEPNMTEDMKELYDQLVSELGLQSVELSNLSSLSVTQQSEKMDYLSIMYENLAQLEVMASENSSSNDFLEGE